MYCALAERLNWSKRGQYQISRGWDGNTHFLRVTIGRNEVGINLVADGMALRTTWEFKLVEMRLVWVMNEHLMNWHYVHAGIPKGLQLGQCWLSTSWTSCTHPLPVKSEISIERVTYGLPVCTIWEFKVTGVQSSVMLQAHHTTHSLPQVNILDQIPFVICNARNFHLVNPSIGQSDLEPSLAGATENS